MPLGGAYCTTTANTGVAVVVPDYPEERQQAMAIQKPAPLAIKQLKRSDLVAQEIKRLITEKNLSPGDRLPREIELRQKQYEYYRDLLLSFPASPAGGPKSHSDEAA